MDPSQVVVGQSKKVLMKKELNGIAGQKFDAPGKDAWCKISGYRTMKTVL